MMNEYDDIINLPHHVSKTHKQMSNKDRSAQFAPFAALAGHETAIIETARLTDDRIMLDESRLNELDYKLQIIHERMNEEIEVKITYFIQDEFKEGGSYQVIKGIVKDIDPVESVIILKNRKKIKIADILQIEGPIFEEVW